MRSQPLTCARSYRGEPLRTVLKKHALYPGGTTARSLCMYAPANRRCAEYTIEVSWSRAAGSRSAHSHSREVTSFETAGMATRFSSANSTTMSPEGRRSRCAGVRRCGECNRANLALRVIVGSLRLIAGERRFGTRPAPVGTELSTGSVDLTFSRKSLSARRTLSADEKAAAHVPAQSHARTASLVPPRGRFQMLPHRLTSSRTRRSGPASR
jgi:hypothetical protein